MRAAAEVWSASCVPEGALASRRASADVASAGDDIFELESATPERIAAASVTEMRGWLRLLRAPQGGGKEELRERLYGLLAPPSPGRARPSLRAPGAPLWVWKLVRKRRDVCDGQRRGEGGRVSFVCV